MDRFDPHPVLTRILAYTGPMGLAILGVLLGYAATGVLIFGTDQLFAVVIPGFRSMSMPPLYYFVVSIFTDTIYSVIGGLVCAKVAKAQARGATLGLIIFGELVGVLSTFYLWHTVPHYYSFALLIVYPPAVWIGSHLAGQGAFDPS